MTRQMQQAIVKGFLGGAAVLTVFAIVAIGVGGSGEPQRVPPPLPTATNTQYRAASGVPRDSELYSEGQQPRVVYRDVERLAPTPEPKPKLPPITKTLTIPATYDKEIVVPDGYVVVSIESESGPFAAIVDGQRTRLYSRGGNPLITPARRVQVQAMDHKPIEITVRFEGQ